ncbi:membrane-associated tyrosine- and threonine-specific cdc2-inhibitory kinase-like isoform X2 [Varroa jacobsoni]|uniref:membrane-associated tyrosine- and threonine-specific cdc2-inhibitory kinase-like isoform X2 n=1 Tax=Varroa jacobsoni TaxID=62625 RepID=UPI000BF86969|nr:membrane-associated tyrosine- and threonine-specific cdc2-inhibitory kinase-like isoform X2 [Varroa jacobsoni]
MLKDNAGSEIRSTKYKMRGTSPQRLPYLLGGAGTPPFGMQRGSLSRVPDKRENRLEALERVTFSGESRRVESPYYNPDAAGKAREPFFPSVFHQICKLGQGSFGEVYKVRSREDGHLYAVKRIGQEFTNEHVRRTVTREVQIMERIPPHPNIVGLKYAWQENRVLYIQTELCAMDLMTHLKHLTDGDPNDYPDPRPTAPEKVPESLCWAVLVDLLQAAEYLHKLRLIHLDIKPDNTFLGLRDGCFKLGDFGVAKDADEPGLMDDEGDGRYLAPEALNGVITELADVFAIGCTVAQMALGLIRPKHRNYGDNWLELKTEPNSWTANESLARDIRMKSQDLWGVLKLMLAEDRVRPSAAALLESPIVHQHRQARQQQLARDRVISRVRGIVSNVVQMLSSFLPVDVVSKVRAVLPRQQQEHAQPQQQAPSRRSLFPPAPVTPRASIRDPRSARRSSDPLRNKGFGVRETPDSDDESSAAPINLSGAFADEA